MCRENEKKLQWGRNVKGGIWRRGGKNLADGRSQLPRWAEDPNNKDKEYPLVQEGGGSETQSRGLRDALGKGQGGEGKRGTKPDA